MFKTIAQRAAGVKRVFSNSLFKTVPFVEDTFIFQSADKVGYSFLFGHTGSGHRLVEWHSHSTPFENTTEISKSRISSYPPANQFWHDIFDHWVFKNLNQQFHYHGGAFRLGWVRRFYGFTVLRFYGFTVLRFCGFAVLRFYGFAFQSDDISAFSVSTHNPKGIPLFATR